MTNLPKYLRAHLSVALVAAGAISSCGLMEATVAEMKTDVPQMALYAAAFNASQTRYRINVSYDKTIAEHIDDRSSKPALYIGRYLKSSPARSNFQALDQLFSELVINQQAFYPGLLELGSSEGRQLLLPVSFNLPLLVFDKSLDQSISDGFVLNLDELEEKSAAVNKSGKTSYTNMGFSPRWYPDFLFTLMGLFGADFKEGSPLKWNHAGLEAGIAYVRGWSARTNGSSAKEDEFQFKYLYLPGYRSVEEGRIGYSSMDSSEFFIVSEERRSKLSFRWVAKDSQVLIDEDVVFAGIRRDGKGKQAAEAFLKWFYREDTQKALLDDARRYRSMESSFGIAGGFSAIKAVNEKQFPLFYPSLLGKMPPERYLKAPSVVPSAWNDIKHSIVLPFLLEATGPNAPPDINKALETRIQAWLKRRSSY